MNILFFSVYGHVLRNFLFQISFTNGRTDMKGIKQIEALIKIDELLNNIPITNKHVTKKITFNNAIKPLQEVQAAPRVNNKNKLVKECTNVTTAVTNNLPLTCHLQG
jgi:hypothetical protein